MSCSFNKEYVISDPRTNERIRVSEVRLVGPSGEQVGVVRIEDALRRAREADLDLVEVAPTSKPPVAKIMDFGKFKYEQAQKAKEARRNQANTVLKEVRFRLKIDDHDYETKRKRAEGFLSAGDKVKAMILFRGREQSRPDQGVRLLQRFAQDVAEFGAVESKPMIDGRNMVMIVGPLRSKSDAKAEQNAVRTAQRAADQERRRAAAEEQAARQAANEPVRPATPVAEPKVSVPVAKEPVARETIDREPTPAPAAAPVMPRPNVRQVRSSSETGAAAAMARAAASAKSSAAASKPVASKAAADSVPTTEKSAAKPASRTTKSAAPTAKTAAAGAATTKSVPRAASKTAAKPAAKPSATRSKPTIDIEKPAATSAAEPAAKPARPAKPTSK